MSGIIEALQDRIEQVEKKVDVAMARATRAEKRIDRIVRVLTLDQAVAAGQEWVPATDQEVVAINSMLPGLNVQPFYED